MASPLSILPSALPPTLPSALTPSLRPPLPPLSSTSSSTPPSSVPHLLSQLLGQLLSSALALHHAGDHPSLLLSVIRGFRQGVVYGAKIRFPHALVMTFLFRTGSLTDKASDIVQATYTHASTLGCYVALYKLLTGALRHLTGHTPSSNALVPLTSGFIAGAALFGRSTPITTQINMYVMSRVIFGALRWMVVKGWMGDWERGWGYTAYAGAVWALVMLLFEMQPKVLQRSLASSMEYLYHDADNMPSKGEPLLDWIIREV